MNVDEFQASIFTLQPFKFDPAPGTWHYHRHAFRRHVFQVDDPLAFLRWSTIKATMFVGNAPYVYQEWDELMADADRERWLAAMRDPGFGSPEPFDLAQGTSGNFIHQTYHLYQWEKHTGKRIQNLSKITEFGGGYGSACVIARNLGFAGQYILHDLPEFAILQEFYLSNVNVPAEYRWILPYTRHNSKDYIWYYDLEPGADLLIANYSLSEVDDTIRNAIFNGIAPDSVLAAHQEEYAHENVPDILHRFADSQLAYDWQFIPNPVLDGHGYMIGMRKD